VTAFLIVAATLTPSLLFVAARVWRVHLYRPAAPDNRIGIDDNLLHACYRIANAEPRKEN
jgi:hypothetical protein